MVPEQFIVLAVIETSLCSDYGAPATNFTCLPLFVLFQVIRMAGSDDNETVVYKFLCGIYRREI